MVRIFLVLEPCCHKVRLCKVKGGRVQSASNRNIKEKTKDGCIPLHGLNSLRRKTVLVYSRQTVICYHGRMSIQQKYGNAIFYRNFVKPREEKIFLWEKNPELFLPIKQCVNKVSLVSKKVVNYSLKSRMFHSVQLLRKQ